MEEEKEGRMREGTGKRFSIGISVPRGQNKK